MRSIFAIEGGGSLADLELRFEQRVQAIELRMLPEQLRLFR